MDNSHPPAWVLEKGPDGKLLSHLEGDFHHCETRTIVIMNAKLIIVLDKHMSVGNVHCAYSRQGCIHCVCIRYACAVYIYCYLSFFLAKKTLFRII